MVPIIDQLSEKSLQYLGKLEKLQQEGSEYKGRRYSALSMTKYQKFLYQRALYGLDIFQPNELKEMHREKKQRILKVHKKAKILVNILKQEKVNKIVGGFADQMFPKSILGSELFSESELIDPDYPIELSLKDLKIDKRVVVDKFIQEGILPPNFYELITDPHGLPQLKQRRDSIPIHV